MNDMHEIGECVAPSVSRARICETIDKTTKILNEVRACLNEISIRLYADSQSANENTENNVCCMDDAVINVCDISNKILDQVNYINSRL